MKSATFEILPNSNEKREMCDTAKAWRLVLFLSWVIGISCLFAVFVLDSPNPFSQFSSKQKLPFVNNNVAPQNALNQTPAMNINPKKEDDGVKYCDLFKGQWVPEHNGSLYTEWSCPTIPDTKNCGKFGRKDVDFVNWRWKPDECELPRFNPKTFLSLVRGKKLAFIGDSLARNQMESLLCLLSQGETPKDIYKDSEDRFRTFYFPSHDFTLMVYWTKFLVAAEDKGIVNGSRTNVFDLHLDKLDVNWADKLPTLDYAIISIAHWFFRMNNLYEGGRLIGCTECNNPNIPDLGTQFTIAKAIRTALGYVSECKECNRGLVTVFRTFSPVHFEYGSWNSGGKCNRTRPYTEEQGNSYNADWEREINKRQVSEFEKIKNTTKGKMFEILDITSAMIMRPDGHPGHHWKDQYSNGKSFTDCVHWCLPGPIDLWNDLLMAVLQRRKGSSV